MGWKTVEWHVTSARLLPACYREDHDVILHWAKQPGATSMPLGRSTLEIESHPEGGLKIICHYYEEEKNEFEAPKDKAPLDKNGR